MSRIVGTWIPFTTSKCAWFATCRCWSEYYSTGKWFVFMCVCVFFDADSEENILCVSLICINGHSFVLQSHLFNNNKNGEKMELQSCSNICALFKLKYVTMIRTINRQKFPTQKKSFAGTVSKTPSSHIHRFFKCTPTILLIVLAGVVCFTSLKSLWNDSERKTGLFQTKVLWLAVSSCCHSLW